MKTRPTKLISASALPCSAKTMTCCVGLSHVVWLGPRRATERPRRARPLWPRGLPRQPRLHSSGRTCGSSRGQGFSSPQCKCQDSLDRCSSSLESDSAQILASALIQQCEQASAPPPPMAAFLMHLLLRAAVAATDERTLELRPVSRRTFRSDPPLTSTSSLAARARALTVRGGAAAAKDEATLSGQAGCATPPR